VLERQHDKCGCGCGRDFFVGPGTEPKFDHRPALGVRAIRDDGSDWIPAQHDPDFICALLQECHDKRTFGPSKATSRGGDVGEIARLKRILKKREERESAPRRDRRKKPKRKMASRGFSKQKRKMSSRCKSNTKPLRSRKNWFRP